MNANQERKQKIIFEITYRGNASNALKAVEKFNKDNADSLKGLGKNYELQVKQLSSRRGFKRAGRSAGKEYSSGFKESMNFEGKSPLDDFIYKSERMRGVTTGLRHEIGKLRNTFLLIAFATSGVVTAFKDWFQESLRAQAAMIGLEAVATSTGLSFKVLKDYSKELETEGFLSVGGSAAALKNLAASNLSLSETQRVLAALTDAAAFNRQGMLSVEEAVVGATQGIKNQNSIMVDNAGITKNISIMYREYAAQIGTTSGKLTEQQKRQAITNGILKEAALFAGNAEKSLSTYQGKITKFNTTLLQTKRNLGDLIAPDIVSGLDSLGKIIKQSGERDALTAGVKIITSYLKTGINLTGILLNNLNKFVKPIEMFAGLLSSPLVKLGGIAILLNKIRGYITSFSSKSIQSGIMATGAVESTKAGLVREMSIRQNLSKQSNITNTKGVGLAQQRLSIARNESVLINDKNLGEKLRLSLQKEINGLANKSVLTKQEELRLQLAINNATKMGFDITKAASGQQVYKAGGLYLSKEGGKAPRGSLVAGRDLTPGIGQYTKSIFALNKIVKFEIVAGFRQMGLAAKVAFSEIQAGGLKSVTTMKLMAAGAKQVANGIKLVGSAVISIALNVFSVILVFQILKDLYDTLIDQPSKLKEEHQKAIDLEKKSLDGLGKKYIEITSAIKSSQKTFNASSGFQNLFTDKGNTIQQVADRLSNVKKEMNSVVVAMEAAKGDAETFETLQQKLQDLQTEFNSYYNEIITRNDQFNQTLETTQNQLESISSSFGGSFSKILGQVKAFQELQQSFLTNRSDLNTIPISDAIKSQLGLQKDEQTTYHALSKINEIKFGQELRSIIEANEKKITDLKQKAIDARLSLVDNSIYKEIELTRQSYKTQISQLKLEEKSLKTDLFKSSIGKASQDLTFNIQMQINSKELTRLRAEVTDFVKSLNSMDLSLDILKFVKDLRESSKLSVKESSDSISKLANLNNIITKVQGSLNSIQKAFNDDLINEKNIDSYKAKLKETVNLLSSNSPAALLSNKVLGKIQGVDSFKLLKTSFKQFEDQISQISTDFELLLSNKSSTIIQDTIKRKTENYYSLLTKSTKEEMGELEKLGKTLDTTQIKAIQKVIFKYSDLTEAQISQKYLLDQLDSKYSSASSSVEDYYKKLNDLQKTQEIENYNLLLSLSQLREGLKDDSDEQKRLDGIIKQVNHSRDLKDQINKQTVLNELLVKQNALYKDTQRKLDISNQGLSKGFSGDFLNKFETWKADFQKAIADTNLSKDSSNKLITQFTNRLVNELNKTTADIEGGLGTGDPFISGLLGLDTNSLNHTLSQLDKLKEEFSFLGTDFLKAIDSRKVAEQMKFNLEAVKQFVSAAGDYFIALGKSIGNGILQQRSVYDDQKALIAEQVDLYKKGELTRLDFSNRVAQIEEYTAKRVKNIWNDIGRSVVQSAVDMTAEVIKQIGIAQAAQAALGPGLSVLGALGAGLSSALPFLGIAAALGIGSSLLSSSNEPTLNLQQSSIDAAASSFGGTIKAEDVNLTISPTFLIEGNQVFIGSGSVVEYTDQATELLKQAIQQSIDNNEIDLNIIRSVS